MQGNSKLSVSLSVIVYLFLLAISKIVDSSILSTPPITIPSEYLDLAKVFSKEIANTLPEHGP